MFFNTQEAELQTENPEREKIVYKSVPTSHNSEREEIILCTRVYMLCICTKCVPSVKLDKFLLICKGKKNLEAKIVHIVCLDVFFSTVCIYVYNNCVCFL